MYARLNWGVAKKSYRQILDLHEEQERKNGCEKAFTIVMLIKVVTVYLPLSQVLIH